MIRMSLDLGLALVGLLSDARFPFVESLGE